MKGAEANGYKTEPAFAQGHGEVPQAAPLSLNVRTMRRPSYSQLPALLLATSGEYGIGQLDIGTRLLADLDDGGKVDFGDFAIFAEDWQKGPGQYVADICGPNGIPDGYVDNFDLSAFCDDYLKDVNDPNTW